MKRSRIEKVISRKISKWLDSIEDDKLRSDLKDNIVVTGGCIVSLLNNEIPNDFDVYFRTKSIAKRVAQYYCDVFNETQKYIQIAKDFIEEDVEHLEDNLKKYKRELEEKEREKKKIKKQKEITKCHEIALKVNQLIDSDIDFTKRGCIYKSSKIIGITPQKTRKWIERNYPCFFVRYF